MSAFAQGLATILLCLMDRGVMLRPSDDGRQPQGKSLGGEGRRSEGYEGQCEKHPFHGGSLVERHDFQPLAEFVGEKNPNRQPQDFGGGALAFLFEIPAKAPEQHHANANGLLEALGIRMNRLAMFLRDLYGFRHRYFVVPVHSHLHGDGITA